MTAMKQPTTPPRPSVSTLCSDVLKKKPRFVASFRGDLVHRFVGDLDEIRDSLAGTERAPVRSINDPGLLGCEGIGLAGSLGGSKDD